MVVNRILLTSINNDKYKRIKPPENKDIISATGLHVKATKLVCIFYEGDHTNIQCKKACKLKLEEMKPLVKEKQDCFGCLRIGYSKLKCCIQMTCTS